MGMKQDLKLTPAQEKFLPQKNQEMSTLNGSITVMFTFSALGMTCPPMIIYPYKRIPEKISVTVNATTGRFLTCRNLFL